MSPARIVCLSGESADWLARIGAWEQVAGVTAYFAQPPDLPPKPRISGFSTANLGAILALRPDLVIGFSDVQADLAAALLRQGLNVLVTNQRSIAETTAALSLLARAAGREAAGAKQLAEFERCLAPRDVVEPRPRVYFEEWHEPLVTAIGWVGELIERAGGIDVFARHRDRRAASERQVQPEEVLEARPDLIFASWCGEPVDWSIVRRRPGWSDLAPLREARLYEIPGDEILQPGWRLIDGYRRLSQAIEFWRAER